MLYYFKLIRVIQLLRIFRNSLSSYALQYICGEYYLLIHWTSTCKNDDDNCRPSTKVYNLIRRCVPPSFVMISLKNIFLFAHKIPRLRQVMIVQDQGTMNFVPQTSVQLTLYCHHGAMYAQQYLLSRLQFFQEFVTTLL